MSVEQEIRDRLARIEEVQMHSVKSFDEHRAEDNVNFKDMRTKDSDLLVGLTTVATTIQATSKAVATTIKITGGVIVGAVAVIEFLLRYVVK